jgi:hypothetical protein
MEQNGLWLFQRLETDYFLEMLNLALEK